MSDDLHWSQSSALADAEETGLTAVLAHSMLGTVSAIRGAIDIALVQDAGGPGRDSLLLIATRRLEFLTAQLRDVAAGVPGSSVVVDVRARAEKDTGSATS
jgi:hypothetical protein